MKKTILKNLKLILNLKVKKDLSETYLFITMIYIYPIVISMKMIAQKLILLLQKLDQMNSISEISFHLQTVRENLMQAECQFTASMKRLDL